MLPNGLEEMWMMMMKMLSFLMLLIFSIQGFASAVAPAPIKSYREWKNEKVQTLMTQNLNLKGQMLKVKSEGNKKTAEVLEKQISQIQWNLEVVRDLSVTDYFVLYLSQQTQSDRFQQAALKMTTNEMAELMEAYAETLGNSAPAETVTRQALISPSPSAHLPASAFRRDQVK